MLMPGMGRLSPETLGLITTWRRERTSHLSEWSSQTQGWMNSMGFSFQIWLPCSGNQSVSV